jgi:phosphatidylglycerophosphate synthase
MQAVIAVPPGAEKMLTQDVAGVPLLVRIMATAVRTGVKEVLLLWPADTDQGVWTKCFGRPELRDLDVHRIFHSAPFDPRRKEAWAAIRGQLADEFLWLPWNFVTSVRLLAAIRPSHVCPGDWNRPVLLKTDSLDWVGSESVTSVEGVPIHSREDVFGAERFLVANSGKSTDGFYSNFNRKLSRPFVWTLTHTPLTPNMVTLAGLAVAVYAAHLYSRGHYHAYVAGAILFFISGLIDEMDGMLARIKFRESAFGTWFEGSVDNLTYLLLFTGMTVGLCRQHGEGELWWGVALVGGCMMSVLVIAIQRQAMTAPDRPHEYSARMNRLMESDANLISQIARQLHVFIKKGVAVHFVLLFTVCGCVAGFLRIAAIGANLTWIIVMFLIWRFTRNQGTTALRLGSTN